MRGVLRGVCKLRRSRLLCVWHCPLLGLVWGKLMRQLLSVQRELLVLGL